MRRLLTGCLVTLLLLCNTLILFGPLMLFALLKLASSGRLRDYNSRAVMWIAETWSEIDKRIFALCLPTRWDIRGAEGLSRDTSDLVISNHQSWVDIPALMQGLNRRTPFFKFFLKKELIWVPFLGLAWWALDYPFMKRYTYYPQVVLGAAFSWGIPMAFTAETSSLPAGAWLLYIANLLWTVGYDTYYAMTDREDDLKIGVKSTAILFGDADRVIILSLQGLALGCLLLAGSHFELGGWFHLGLLAAAGCFVWEFWYTRDRDPQRCFKAFLHNHWAGLAIFVGIVLNYAVA